MSITRTGVGMAILLALVLSAVLWVNAQPVHAQSTTECQAKIDALREATSTAEFNTPKDQAGLLGKLDSASAKLSQGKLDQEDASNLNALADEAIGCVQDLIDTQGSPTAA